MALILGAGNLGEYLTSISNNGRLTNYDTEAAAAAAVMPPLQPNQKGVLVTVTTGGESELYLKTAGKAELIPKS